MPISLVARYCVLVLVGVALASALYFRTWSPLPAPTSSGSSGVIGRMAWYRAHAAEFDLVILGDSRTYCGVHPFLLDPVLGTRSFNLAQFAHWFQTQYPMIRDLAPDIPAGTTVVWSVGHQNFFPGSTIQRVYPVGPMDGLRYLMWRVPGTGLVDNVTYYNPFTHLIAARGDARRKLFERLNQPLRSASFDLIGSAHAAQAPEVPAGCAWPSEPACAEARWQSDPRFAAFNFTEDGGRRNSMVFYTTRGSYFRVELDPAYFRGKQRELAPQRMTDEQAAAWATPAADPGLWRLFEEMLAVFRSRGVHLIVNEVEEAPQTYPHPLVREKYRAFMRDVVRPRVLHAGFTYVRADFDQLHDEHYFDYNHLNSEGALKYDALLAGVLAPHIRRRP